MIGGHFYTYVVPYLDHSYGLNTYSRIIDPFVDEIISIKTRGVTGLRAGMQEQFKQDFRVMDYIKFGKIPVELKVKLSTQNATLYFSHFLTPRSPELILQISSGFNIGKKLNFSELSRLIEILVALENVTPDDFFSSYKEITSKQMISRSLKPALINKLLCLSASFPLDRKLITTYPLNLG